MSKGKSLYITREMMADKARKKARRKQWEAQLAEAAAVMARERLNKEAGTDMVVMAKSVLAGTPTALTKRDFFLELQKRAERDRRPDETSEAAFARYATTDPDGRLLMQAHKRSQGGDYTGEPEEDDDAPAPNDAYRRLMDVAAEECRDGETLEQAFARIYADPKYRHLVVTEKIMHKAAVAKVAATY